MLVSERGLVSIKKINTSTTSSSSSYDPSSKSAKTLYNSFSFGAETWRTTPEQYIQNDAMLAFVKNLGIKTKEIRDFKLSSQIIEADKKRYGINIGKREGIHLDDGFYIIEIEENSEGLEIEKKKGFARVIKTGDNVNNSNNLEEELSSKPDSYFKELKHELSDQYNKNDGDLYSILPLAFAAVREASKRTLGLRHFDSQMLGGISLAEGNIAEMKTGEGKTLVATLPAYLNSAIGNKAVLVTVNDYLAKRDAEWMRPIYEFLGLTVGIVNSNQDIKEKIDAYKCDVIYATNNELGFDYLRDNMAHSVEERVQCSLDFAIVDEVDSILIDEARTPLIISGPSSESSDLYQQIRKFIPKLSKQLREETEEEPLSDDERGHYLIDEKNRSVELTDDGYFLVEGLLEDADIIGGSDGLYSVSNLKIMKFVQATLRAHFLFQKNVHYLVRNNEVLLIDEHTGRTMPGRRMSCLLYTSPSPRDRTRSRMPSSA